MIGTSRLRSPLQFSKNLFERMIPINPAIKKLALYEFRYALDDLYPEAGWDSVELDQEEVIERVIKQRGFYEAIQTKPREKDRIILDESIARLTRMLFAGLLRGKYTQAWLNKLFYFDVRGFYFLPRTIYFTEAGVAHLGGKPFHSFEPRQKQFENVQDIGYWDFQGANTEIDQALIESIQTLIADRGTPMLITLAGPTAAGKTEIVERLLDTFENMGKKITAIEMDNFLLDRDFRDNKVMGKETIHFKLFKHSLLEILEGKKISIPRYDSLSASSSHDLEGNLRPGCISLEIEPADIIFLEGNFPFQMEEIAGLIGLKVVYLTDDPIRLKRKWKRDIDYRKNYDPAHFRNRFFKTQFLRAEDIYRPLIEKCDMVVDTTGAALWATPEIAEILGQN
jgi:uridine kinase